MANVRRAFSILVLFTFVGLFIGGFVSSRVSGSTSRPLDEGWTITSFQSDITVAPDSTLTITEDMGASPSARSSD